MQSIRLVVLAALVARTSFPASLAVSTYLKDGFWPAAIAADAQGNIYLAGRALTDMASQTTGAAVVKFDSKVSQYLYFTYLDSAASDSIAGMAIDSAGNVYVAGATANANFPGTGTEPTGNGDTRTFVTKLNPQGSVVFSVLVGGATPSIASGIALTPQGQILVSGIASAKGFPTTAGAYTVTDSTNQWFTLELDPTGAKTIFSATGIGGASLAVDSAGNIYMAGSSTNASYPTTPGAYQTTFTPGYYCYGFCQFGYSGNLQHVTKLDPTGSKLLYSTGLNESSGRSGSITNSGLAVDAAGNAYVTGTLFESDYPFTTASLGQYSGYISKLDPAGANLLFSVPVGGGGVELDSSGALYVAGTIQSLEPYLALVPPSGAVAVPAIFSWIPQQCLPNFTTAVSEAYVVKLDATTGTVQDGQWIDGAGALATAITVSGGKVWLAGSTTGAQTPLTPAALLPTNLPAGSLSGTFVAAVDFSATPSGPTIACVLDGGNLTHVSAIATSQLISIFGSNLGPATGVSASASRAYSLGGVSIAFNGQPASLLYVSASQIDVAAPLSLMAPQAGTLPTSAVMALDVNGVQINRVFPVTITNPNLFADLSVSPLTCANAPTASGYQPVALNADGTRNTCANPAHYGTTVSLFMHGIASYGITPTPLLGVGARLGECAAAAIGAHLVTDFVYQVDIGIPAQPLPCIEPLPAGNFYQITLTYNGAPVGPFTVPSNLAGPVFSPAVSAVPLDMIVWVKP